MAMSSEQAMFEHPPERYDPVERPKHYAFGGIECIEAMEASMSPEAYRGFLKGNVQKYVWRYETKNGLQDLQKAKWYLDQLIFCLEMDAEKEALDAIAASSECKDGVCPIPGIRFDIPPKKDGEMFKPIHDS